MTSTTNFYRNFVGIGVELTGIKPCRSADIERTLLAASERVESEDRRILGLLASWIVVHGSLVCIGKLRRVMEREQLGDRQMISALAFLAVEKGMHEWKAVCQPFSERYLWGEEGTKQALKFQKPVPSFSKAGVLLPEKSLRIRENDILSIRKLAKVNLPVRFRLIFGANIRADAAFYISKGARSASELMRAIGCSYEPAHRILQEFTDAGGLLLPNVRLEQFTNMARASISSKI